MLPDILAKHPADDAPGLGRVEFVLLGYTIHDRRQLAGTKMSGKPPFAGSLPRDLVPIALLPRLAYRFCPVWRNAAGSVALMPQKGFSEQFSLGASDDPQ